MGDPAPDFPLLHVLVQLPLGAEKTQRAPASPPPPALPRPRLC